MNYDVKIDKYGNKRYYVNNILHWEDGPAVEGVGEKHWFKNGKRHREDGPAVEWANGTKFWYKDGKKHGKGVLHFADRSVYEGEFFENEISG